VMCKLARPAVTLVLVSRRPVRVSYHCCPRESLAYGPCVAHCDPLLRRSFRPSR
jgi:hypothetical protein